MCVKIGKYTIFGQIAQGGMASIHLGISSGQAGFARTVAVKRMLDTRALSSDFAGTLVDEARLLSQIHHPNVVPVLDVVEDEGEVFLVMEYIEGETLGKLIKACSQRGEHVPLRIAAAIAVNTLEGLHAAHEARDAHGRSLSIVHRDVSPDNVMVGLDGVARLLDFGIAKSNHREQLTTRGTVKGKLGYLSPEQALLKKVDRRTDIYSASVVLWECITGRRLFFGDLQSVFKRIRSGDRPSARAYRAGLHPDVERVLERGLALNKEDRYESAQEMVAAIEETMEVATPREVRRWMQRYAAEALRGRAEAVADVERRAAFEFDNSLVSEIVSAYSLEVSPELAPAITGKSLQVGARAWRWESRGLALLAVAVCVALIVLTQRPVLSGIFEPRSCLGASPAMTGLTAAIEFRLCLTKYRLIEGGTKQWLGFCDEKK